MNSFYFIIINKSLKILLHGFCLSKIDNRQDEIFAAYNKINSRKWKNFPRNHDTNRSYYRSRNSTLQNIPFFSYSLKINHINLIAYLSQCHYKKPQNQIFRTQYYRIIRNNPVKNMLLSNITEQTDTYDNNHSEFISNTKIFFHLFYINS